MIKTAAEIAAIAANMKVTAEAFLLVEQILRVSRVVGQSLEYEHTELTSEWLQEQVSDFFLTHDLHSPVGMIIASGTDAAEPHYPGAGPILADSSIVVDLFPQSRANGLFADMSRTYVKGTPSVRLLDMFEAVQAAHTAALAALQPGITAAALYQISVDSITAAGYPINAWEPGAVGYIHSLGHGVGTDVHEAPKLGRDDHTILAPGMVLTIEPGLYNPAVGGVRIEDTVVVTETGYTNLTNHPINLLV